MKREKMMIGCVCCILLLASPLSMLYAGVNGEQSAQIDNTIYVTKDDLSTKEFVESLVNNPQMAYKYENVLNVEQRVMDNITPKEQRMASENNMEYVSTLTKMTYRADEEKETVIDFYVMSVLASEKTSENSITSKGVTLNGCIGWIDNLGPVNEFVYASGSRSGTYTGKGSYAAYRGTTVLCSGEFDGSFFATSSRSDNTGFQFRLLIRSGTLQDKDAKIELLFGTNMLD